MSENNLAVRTLAGVDACQECTLACTVCEENVGFEADMFNIDKHHDAVCASCFNERFGTNEK